MSRSVRHLRAACAAAIAAIGPLACASAGIEQARDISIRPTIVVWQTTGAEQEAMRARGMPVRLTSAQPEYPMEFASRRIEGCVLVSAEVQLDGSVDHIEVARAAPPGVFDELAVLAARRWVFEAQPKVRAVKQPMIFQIPQPETGSRIQGNRRRVDALRSLCLPANPDQGSGESR